MAKLKMGMGTIVMVGVPAAAAVAYFFDCFGLCTGLKASIDDFIGGLLGGGNGNGNGNGNGCTKTCTAPQVLDEDECECKTPVVPCTTTCTAPQVLDTVTCTCKTPTPPATGCVGPHLNTFSSAARAHLCEDWCKGSGCTKYCFCKECTIGPCKSSGYTRISSNAYYVGSYATNPQAGRRRLEQRVRPTVRVPYGIARERIGRAQLHIDNVAGLVDNDNRDRSGAGSGVRGL